MRASHAKVLMLGCQVSQDVAKREKIKLNFLFLT